jgi:hypothetical protein
MPAVHLVTGNEKERVSSLETSFHMLSERLDREFHRIDQKIDDLKSEQIRRFEGGDSVLDKLLVALAVDAEHVHEAIRREIQSSRDTLAVAIATIKESVVKADVANEKRFDGVNEFRAQQADIIAKFPMAETVNALIAR